MARPLLARIVPRPRRLAALMFPALLITLAVGCGHHKRTSLRPVYVSPPRATGAAPCPTGDCGASVVPSGSPTTSSVDPSVIESGASGTGSVLPDAATTPAPPLRPVPAPAPSRSSDTPPPVSGPPMPGFSDEPGLTPVQPENSSKVPATKGTATGTGTGGSPSASLRGGTGTATGTGSGAGRRPASGRLRSASLRDALMQYTGDPDDLFSPPKADRPWKFIVLHHSAGATGSYDSIDQEHRKRLGWQGCGYHFVIGNGTESPDGRIEVAQRWSNQKHGVHCRDARAPEVSEYGIGICLVGDLETSPPTDRQVAAARALVAYLSDRYQIAADHAETHTHLAASPTSCPGRMFPTQAILGSKGLALR